VNDSEKKWVAGGAAVVSAVGWSMWRSNERSRLKAMLLADPRSVLIPNVDQTVINALPFFSMKSADTAFVEVTAPLLPIPKQIAPAIRAVEDVLRIVGQEGSARRNEGASPNPVSLDANSPPGGQQGASGAHGPTTQGPLGPMSADVMEASASRMDVFGNPVVQHTGELIDFEEWASKFAR